MINDIESIVSAVRLAFRDRDEALYELNNIRKIITRRYGTEDGNGMLSDDHLACTGEAALVFTALMALEGQVTDAKERIKKLEELGDSSAYPAGLAD